MSINHDRILNDNQVARGMTTEIDDHVILLMHNGKPVLDYYTNQQIIFTQHTPIAEIRQAADNYLETASSGIEFARVSEREYAVRNMPAPCLLRKCGYECQSNCQYYILMRRYMEQKRAMAARN